jgi:hypothetical protein
VWSASPDEQVTDTPVPQLQSKRSTFKAMLWDRGMPTKGTQVGNPFDPILPLRMAAPRNGVCSGQVVLSDLDGLRDITAALGPLKGPQGATIPATSVKIRYAVQPAGQHYCDALMPTPPDGAKTMPVWTIIDIPKGQAPGWYTASLALGANGKRFTAPVQVLVTGDTLPEASDFSPNIGVTQSPDAIAAHYKVEPWSDKHFTLLEPSLALMGQLGNDVLQVPVITRNQFNWKAPLVRFIKTDEGLVPDFTLLDRYLDLYVKYCAPPKALCLYIWDAGSASRVTVSREGNQQTDVVNQKVAMPLMVALWDTTTKTLSEVGAPAIGEPGSEQFYKRLVNGVRDRVVKRGWSERCVLLAMGGDRRPCAEHAALMKEWLPYARWDILSHFSGDPGSIFNRTGPGAELLKAGKMVATGGAGSRTEGVAVVRAICGLDGCPVRGADGAPHRVRRPGHLPLALAGILAAVYGPRDSAGVGESGAARSGFLAAGTRECPQLVLLHSHQRHHVSRTGRRRALRPLPVVP